MIKVSEREHAEHLNNLSETIDRSDRLVQILEARLEIARGNRGLAVIRFWDYAAKIAPGIKNHSLNSVKWDMENSTFITGEDRQGV